NLPERGAPIETKCVERADFGQRCELIATNTGRGNEIVERPIPRLAIDVAAGALDGALLAAGRVSGRVRPFVRTDVAEISPCCRRLEHRPIVTPALRAPIGGRHRRMWSDARITITSRGPRAAGRNQLTDLFAQSVHVH